MFNERLLNFVETIGLTQKELAKAIGVSSQQFYLYSSGKQKPGFLILQKLIEFGCNINWLLTGEGSMFADNEAGRMLKEKHVPEQKKSNKEEGKKDDRVVRFDNQRMFDLLPSDADKYMKSKKENRDKNLSASSIVSGIRIEETQEYIYRVVDEKGFTKYEIKSPKPYDNYQDLINDVGFIPDEIIKTDWQFDTKQDYEIFKKMENISRSPYYYLTIYKSRLKKLESEINSFFPESYVNLDELKKAAQETKIDLEIAQKMHEEFLKKEIYTVEKQEDGTNEAIWNIEKYGGKLEMVIMETMVSVFSEITNTIAKTEITNKAKD